MKKMKLKIMLIIMVAVLVAIAGCATQLNGKATEETIKMAYIGPMTGEAAALGINNFRGVEIAVEEINAKGGIAGMPVKLIVEDDQLNDVMTQKAFFKVANIDNVDVVLGASYGGILTLADTFDQEKIVFVDTIDTSEELAEAGEYLFTVGIYDEGIGYTVAEIASEELGKEKIATIYLQEEAFMVLAKDAMKEKFAEFGGEVVIEEGYTFADRDFKTSLMKIKAKGIDTVAFFGYDEAGLILKQAKELGLEMNFIGIDTVTSEGFQRNAGDVEGLYFTFWETPETPKMEAFIAEYNERYQEEPEQLLFTVTAYDAAMFTAKAIENAIEKGGEPRGEDLKEEIYKMKDFEGLSGPLTMEEDGAVRTIVEEKFKFEKGEMVMIR